VPCVVWKLISLLGGAPAGISYILVQIACMANSFWLETKHSFSIGMVKHLYDREGKKESLVKQMKIGKRKNGRKPSIPARWTVIGIPIPLAFSITGRNFSKFALIGRQQH